MLQCATACANVSVYQHPATKTIFLFLVFEDVLHSQLLQLTGGVFQAISSCCES